MNYDAINQRIQALESELAGLKSELAKPEKFEFKYKGSTYTIFTYKISKVSLSADPEFLQNFRYRQTESNAQADFQLQKELMCIGALAEQIDPNYKNRIKWLVDNNFYSIQQDMRTGEYQVYHSYPKRSLGVVYMPKDVAEKVCDILNNKQVEL